MSAKLFEAVGLLIAVAWWLAVPAFCAWLAIVAIAQSLPITVTIGH